MKTELEKLCEMVEREKVDIAKQIFIADYMACERYLSDDKIRQMAGYALRAASIFTEALIEAKSKEW